MRSFCLTSSAQCLLHPVPLLLGKNAAPHRRGALGLPTVSPGAMFFSLHQTAGGRPVIHSGIKDLKVLKTTQSGFEGFIRDQFSTLPETKDRIFATQVYCRWRYHPGRDVDFDATWDTMRDIILKKFAGPFDRGEYSPSVQRTLCDIQMLSLSQIPEIEDVELSLPNIHYVEIDMSKMGLINKEEVFLPLDNPYGRITGKLKRKPTSKL
ncbi:uricase [Camelus ferus]|nr:uricase [Camelus ferus]